MAALANAQPVSMWEPQADKCEQIQNLEATPPAAEDKPGPLPPGPLPCLALAEFPWTLVHLT